MKESQVICVSGIDTDIGKTIATGLIAKSFLENGINTITQKFVQTGCNGLSEDIEVHRQLMGQELLDIDKSGVTCPYVFKKPCSPHLAAKLEDKKIDCDVIRETTRQLLTSYDIVLLEGAGGLSVPITINYTFIDYIEEEKIPLVLVTSSRLGSINHTLNSLEIAKSRNIRVIGLIYNLQESSDQKIVADSREIFEIYLQKLGFDAPVVDMHALKEYRNNFLTFPNYYKLLHRQQ